jgi:xanthine dehydrogenase accessory factor
MKRWMETRQVLERLDGVLREGTRAALATVIHVRGSAYRHEGAKLLVTADGQGMGNVSGGCLEADVREVAHQVMRTGVAERRTYRGGANEVAAWDLGVGCDGEVEILIEPAGAAHAQELALMDREEPFVTITRLGDGVSAGELARWTLTAGDAAGWIGDGRSRLVEHDGNTLFVDVLLPPPRLLIVSAGDDAVHLARIARDVGFRVVVADRRAALLTRERFPDRVGLVETDASRLLERIVLDAGSFAVVMTHHFNDDTSYLRALLRSPVRYIGMLGPRQRTERMLAALRAELKPAGETIDESRIYGPVGLDIGTDGAEQVALSVIAEILAVRGARHPVSLRDRVAPIHADAE